MPIYKLSKDAVLETFEDGGLVLIVPERRLVEINPIAVDILNLLDGHRASEQVADEIIKSHDISHDISVTQVLQDVLELCVELQQSGVLEIQPDLQESVDMTTAVATNFLRNPDVVLREEDPDEGALLFNPDTNQVKVINTTGLFIWQQCGVARTLDEIVAEVQKGFDEVPSGQVAEDVKEFVDGMLASGFIGTVVS
jgi:hypothetical protein